MEGFVAQKLNDFENGKISRRSLIEMLTLAAATVGATGAVQAQAADPALKVALVNHVSYNCPNFKEAADWYSKVFNLDQVGATNHDVALPFGKRGEHPYNVTANDVPLTHLIMRTQDLNEPPPRGGPPKRKSRAVIDHICYTVLDFDQERAKAELIALGVKNIRPAGRYSFHVDDLNGYDVQIAGLANSALSGGG